MAQPRHRVIAEIMRRSSFSKFDGWWRENHASAVLVAVMEQCQHFSAALLDRITGTVGSTWDCVNVSREVVAANQEGDGDEDDTTDDERRRIDLLVSATRATEGIAVGIEVKLDAPFRDGQLSAYHAWLSRDGAEGAYLAVLVPDYRIGVARCQVAQLGSGCPVAIITWSEIGAIVRAVPANAPGWTWAAELKVYIEDDLMGTFTGLPPDLAAVAPTGQAMASYLHFLTSLAATIGAKPTKARLGTDTGRWKTYDYVSLYIRCKRGEARGWLSLTSYTERLNTGGTSLYLEAEFDGPPVASIPVATDRLIGGRDDVAAYVTTLGGTLVATLDGLDE